MEHELRFTRGDAATRWRMLDHGLQGQAPVPLPAGRWRVRAVHTTGEFPWVGLVQLLPEGPC